MCDTSFKGALEPPIIVLSSLVVISRASGPKFATPPNLVAASSDGVLGGATDAREKESVEVYTGWSKRIL